MSFVYRIYAHTFCLLRQFTSVHSLYSKLADEDDLHGVISAVVGLAGRWQELGIALKLRQGDLDTISTSAQSPDGYLRKLLTLWLKQSYNVCITIIHLVMEFWSAHWAVILLGLMN